MNDPGTSAEIEKNNESLSWIGSTKDILIEAMDRHILANGTLTCKYKREGIKIPSLGYITWLDEGTPWAMFRVEDIAYNVDIEEYVRAKGL